MTSFAGLAAGAAQVTGLLFGPQKVQIGEGVAANQDINKAGFFAVECDASLTELHEAKVQITDHPIEDGADISDHVRVLPKRVRITGLKTNTPVVFLASLQTDSDAAEQYHQDLITMLEAGLLVSVVTTLHTYDNMVIESISVPRDAAKGNVVEATIILREMFIVASEVAPVTEPVNPSDGAAVDTGKSGPPKAAPTPTADKGGSILGQLSGVGR